MVVVTAEEKLRNVLEHEAVTRTALKRAKAKMFLDLATAGRRLTDVWQLIADDEEIQLLEDRYEAARIDLLVENAINWGGLAAHTPEEEAAS
jgi:hypothetical protein